MHRQGHRDDVTGETDGTEEVTETPDADEVDWEDETTAPYTWGEWRGVIVPALVAVAVMVIAVSAWYVLRDTEPEAQRLNDLETSGSFNLLGYYREPLTAYGPHARSINLTLEEGDVLELSYLVNGPPDGIQVRLQHPLHPDDGADGTGGATVHASAVGRNGTLRFSTTEAGAYQVYFWHPGSARPPGAGDDPEVHMTAAVAYDLSVVRAHRP